MLLRLWRTITVEFTSIEPYSPISTSFGLAHSGVSAVKSSPPSLSELAEQNPASRSFEIGESISEKYKLVKNSFKITLKTKLKGK